MKTIAFSTALLAVTTAMVPAQNSRQPDQAKLEQMTARFAPTEITADVSKLSPNDRKVLARLVEASQIIDGIFLRQAWAGNPSMLLDLAGDTERRKAARDFIISSSTRARGRGSITTSHSSSARRRNRKAPTFTRSTRPRPRSKHGSNLFPRPNKNAPKVSSPWSVDEADKKFTLVPYNIEYEGELIRAAALLREAAAAASEPTLKQFLTTRADAFLSNDYYESDVAWMELKGAIEPTIGPYEVYEDEWFNYKAGFRVVHHRAGRSGEREAARNFPASSRTSRTISRSTRNIATRSSARFRRWWWSNEIFCAGDANHGVQTAAFNLPNDERVTREKGSKRVMLKNVQDAKFAKTLVPISKVVLSPDDQKDLSFDAFFTHIVVHELMHGLGPHDVTTNGREIDRARRVERSLQRAGGSKGGHLRRSLPFST